MWESGELVAFQMSEMLRNHFHRALLVSCAAHLLLFPGVQLCSNLSMFVKRITLVFVRYLILLLPQVAELFVLPRARSGFYRFPHLPIAFTDDPLSLTISRATPSAAGSFWLFAIVKSCSFRGLLPRVWHLGKPFWHLLGSLEDHEAGRTLGVWSRILIDVGLVLGTYFQSVSGTET